MSSFLISWLMSIGASFSKVDYLHHLRIWSLEPGSGDPKISWLRFGTRNPKKDGFSFECFITAWWWFGTFLFCSIQLGSSYPPGIKQCNMAMEDTLFIDMSWSSCSSTPMKLVYFPAGHVWWHRRVIPTTKQVETVGHSTRVGGCWEEHRRDMIYMTGTASTKWGPRLR